MGYADDVAGCFEQLNMNTQAQSVRLVDGDAQLFLVATISDIGAATAKDFMKLIEAGFQH